MSSGLGLTVKFLRFPYSLAIIHDFREAHLPIAVFRFLECGGNSSPELSFLSSPDRNPSSPGRPGKGDPVDSRHSLTDRVISLEWDMFQAVQNIGGRASCQDDRASFQIMRRSQFESWSEPPLESYWEDLLEAGRTGRNLISEKYGRMMSSTSPGEYARIEHFLPPLSEEVHGIIEKITGTILEWEEELIRKYPYILRRSRPLRTSMDSSRVTSLETYLRGELATYSRKTLELYYEHLLEERAGKINGPEITLRFLAGQYGYKSLEEAERKMKEKTTPADEG